MTLPRVSDLLIPDFLNGLSMLKATAGSRQCCKNSKATLEESSHFRMASFCYTTVETVEYNI